MATRLTKKEKGFADKYLETGNRTQAALDVYETTDYMTAANIGSENLKKPKVIAYLESKADRAAERIVELSEQEKMLPVALGASKDILDRAGYKPIEKSVVSNFNVDVELNARGRELLSRLLHR